MQARHLIVLLAALTLIALPVADADAKVKKGGGSPGKKASKKKNNKKKSGNGGGSSVAKVSNNLRQKFGGIAAGKLPAALIAYHDARAKIRDAETAMTRLMREQAVDKVENRREIASRVQQSRETYIAAERYYGESMVRVRNRLKRDNQYRVMKADLAAAKRHYDAERAKDGQSSDAILALGEVVSLESELEEMEYDAMGTDQEALQAKSNYEDAKYDYNAARRELLAADHGSTGHRAAIRSAYEAIEDARRVAAAKGRTVQQYKYLIKTATFQKTVLGAGKSNKSSGGKARKAKKPKKK